MLSVTWPDPLATDAQMRDFALSRIVYWSVGPIRYRRILLELWGMSVLAGITGFMGPFGTYSEGSIVARIEQWWLLLMGAYLLVRPCIALFRRMADRMALPERAIVGWGVVVISAPLAMIWRAVGQNAYRELDGYAELVPFAFLCAVSVLGVTWWARNVERRLVATELPPGDAGIAAVAAAPTPPSLPATPPAATGPRLLSRLSPAFRSPIIALQSDDHYVHVHGASGKELLLMRLREAIAEMGDEPGEQIHRSWWVARSGIARIERTGRSMALHLVNGEIAPVSRDAVYRLQRSGFLSADEVGQYGRHS